MLVSEKSRRVISENRILTFMLLGKEQNVESLLGQTEQAKNCDLEMLLQKAAEYNTNKVTQCLMELCAKVDYLNPTLESTSLVNTEKSVMQAVLYLTTNTRQFFRSMKHYETLQASFPGVKNQKLGSLESFADKLMTNRSSIFQAAFFDDVELMECMTKRGVRVDVQDLRGMTAHYGTAIAGYIRTADWLVGKGADLNAIDADGRSPLFVAALNCDKSMMQLLLERGADPNTEETERSPMFAVFASACNLFYPSELRIQRM